MSDTTNPLTSQVEPATVAPQVEPATVAPQVEPANVPSKFSLKKAIIKNWKTTTVGVVISFTGFVSFSPQSFGGDTAPFVQVCKYVTSGGLAALGISSKDYNVTGGN